MSLRIKLPAKNIDTDSTSQPSSSDLPSRRKIAKRRIAIDSDDEIDQVPPRSGSPLSSAIVREPSHTTEEDADFGTEEEITIESDPQNLAQSNSQEYFSSGSRLKKRARPTGDGPPPTKKKRVVVSEDENYTEEEMGTLAMDSDDGDDNFMTGRKRISSQSGKAKTKNSKGRSMSNNIEVSTKEERKIPSGKMRRDSMVSSPVAGVKRSRAAQSSKLENPTVDNEDIGSTTTIPTGGSPLQSKEASPQPIKKRKFPTIKKNKGASTPTAAVSAGTPKTGPLTNRARTGIPGIPENSKPTNVRVPPAMAGNADFDLRNASVYRELFKSTGGSTPRSGLNRREKDEERRRELNKMRDEAKAKRLAETSQPFDLQGQMDKISRFEERLKSSRSSALYPNFLAAKWRELWEHERRRRQKGQEWQENRNWDATGDREEGEMNDSPSK